MYCINCGKELKASKVLGMILYEMSIRTIFGHEKFSMAFNVGSDFRLKLIILNILLLAT